MLHYANAYHEDSYSYIPHNYNPTKELHPMFRCPRT